MFAHLQIIYEVQPRKRLKAACSAPKETVPESVTENKTFTIFHINLSHFYAL